MEVNFRPETESRLRELAQQAGHAPDELVEDAMAGYLKEFGETRAILDNRYYDLNSNDCPRSMATPHLQPCAARANSSALAHN